MTVRIVTDSVADIPRDFVRDLGISVVPLALRFGDTCYHDGVDLDTDGFYGMLASRTDFPASSAPSSAAFAQAFDAAAIAGDAVLAITLSAKLSGTHDAALQGRSLAADPSRVEVMDSGHAAIAEGFVVLAAARAAMAGASVAEAAAAAREVGRRVQLLAAFDTLEYLRRGGRIGAAASLLGSLLHINPIIAVRDGVVHPVGRTRSRAKALDELVAFACGYARIDDLAVSDAACPEDAEALVERLSILHPRERILRTRMTPVIGCHTGPGLIVVTVVGEKRRRP
ncbi:MAG TPA: DegV family protein [Desulfobacterales bacterium]|nr:DegV family protein [Desulfobacterales bacterium]